MDKKLFKSIVALLGITALLALAVLNFHAVLKIIAVLTKVLMPVLIGLVIALILNRPFEWFRKKYLRLFRNARNKNALSIGFSTATTYLAVFAFIAMFLIIVAPKIVYSIGELISNADLYLNKIENAINSAIAGSEALNGKIDPVDLSGVDDWIVMAIDRIADAAKHRFPELLGMASEIVDAVVSAVLGIVISVYILISRHHLKWQAKKVVYTFLPQKAADFIRDTARLSAHTFSNYISGRILDSVIVGILCFIGMVIFRFEYAALISFIVGVTNFIPMIGPPLGIIPSAILLLLVSPVQCFWFLVFICILMFLDSNLIDLRISGEATGLPSLFVLIIVIGGGALLGFVGFIILVPAGAVIYNLAKRAVIRRTKEKNIPLDDEPCVDPPKKSKKASEQPPEETV